MHIFSYLMIMIDNKYVFFSSFYKYMALSVLNYRCRHGVGTFGNIIGSSSFFTSNICKLVSSIS